VFRHTGDDTTLLLACLSSGMGTKNTDRLGVFRHSGDENVLPSGGPLLGCGTKCTEIRAKLPLVFRHSEDDTTLL